MTIKRKKTTTQPQQKTYFVGFECNENQFYWLQYQARLKGRKLEDMAKEGLNLVKSIDEDLLQLVWLESIKKNVFMGELIANAIRASLKLPQKRLKKHDYPKVELTVPVNQQVKELRAKMLSRKKPVKVSRTAKTVSDANKIMDTQAHIEKVIGIEEKVQRAKK